MLPSVLKFQWHLFSLLINLPVAETNNSFICLLVFISSFILTLRGSIYSNLTNDSNGKKQRNIPIFTNF